MPPNRSRYVPPPSKEPRRFPSQNSSSKYLPQIIAPWRHWDSVAVNLANIPKEANTLILWEAFSEEGNVYSIDIFEDIHGTRESKGRIRFKPPPQSDFWRCVKYHIKLPDGKPASVSVCLDNKAPEFQVPSSVRPDVAYPAELRIPISCIDIGIMFDETTMLPMRSVGARGIEPASLVLDLIHRDLLVYFHLSVSTDKHKITGQKYRLKVPFAQLNKLSQANEVETGGISHFTILDSPPIYHRRIGNIASTFTEETNWRESDTWFRQTHIVHNPQELSTLPVSLRRQSPIIDIGRWNTLRIAYLSNCDDKGELSLLCNILSDYNIAIEKTDRFTLWDSSEPRPTPIWNWIDVSDSKTSKTAYSSLEDLLDPKHIHLPSPVRYQLEVCLSNGYLSEYNMTREFALRLAELGESDATKLLEHVATQKRIYYDPMGIFDLKFVKGVTNTKIPSYCCYMRSARVTPSTVYYNTPTVDISNRVIRHYIEHADCFLRVRFTDEKLLGRIHSKADSTMDEVFTRIKRALANGIVIGGMHYEFLAFGNSQFREHGAYFFAPKNGVTAANIRAWMGHFSDIRNIAKHAARLGQCFSTTRAVSSCSVHIKRIEEVTRNGYTFSDGVGRISRFLAQMAASELKIKTPTGDPPSAFQFRLGGCKGMLTVSPEAKRQEIHIRKSQFKFAAIHNGLEIIRWSQFSLATLNRQLILVLSTLGIPDEIFSLKLKAMLQSLDEAMESDTKAVYLLKKYVDPNQMALNVGQMVLDGFRRAKEPFVTSVLNLWRVWHLKYLKEKAKIVIDKGACVLGCMDETATLKGYFSDKIPGKDASLDEKIAALPEIFIQVSRPENGGKYKVIEGLCILARNPSLHPGDIRTVRAVNVPQLNHLQDVVVLPQTGDRDVGSMCSGGDLDGDDYLVIWDQDLLPQDWFRSPMHYTSNKAHDLDHDVTVDDITSFFVTYMKNDCLPTIAHAHLAWGDYLEDGVNEAKCIQLAQLHSDAVDYNKTGNPAVMTRNLYPRKWPHFMEKNHKPKHQIYRSGTILGQLYDAVERIDFVPNLGMEFDLRILNCRIEVHEKLCEFAQKLKMEYDTAIRRVMAQHEIKTEFEVWSTFVLSHSNMSKDYKFHEDIGVISASLKEGFRKRVYDEVGGRTFEKLAPIAVAMYRVTHEEMTIALKKHQEENPPDEMLFHTPTPRIEQLPLVSFPWLFSHVLGRIATGLYEHPEPLIPDLASLGLKEPMKEKWNDTDTNFKGNYDSKSAPNEEREAWQKEVDDDPFGLNLNDQPSSSTNFGDKQRSPYEGGSGDIQSLEQLLDFGLLDPPSTPLTPLTIFPAAVVAPTDELPGDVTLLDLDPDPPRDECVRKRDDDQTYNKENEPVGGYRGGNKCIEIVEDERTYEPTALDKLNEMLGM